MNYLAHLALSEPEGLSFIGGLLPDLSCGNANESRPVEIYLSMDRHHCIDRFTDRNELVRALRSRLFPEAPQHAPILQDIAFDHFLATHWERWYKISLSDFENHIYRELEKNIAAIPEKALPFFNSLLKHRWLSGYRLRVGVSHSLNSVANKLRVPNRFKECYSVFLDKYEDIEDVFLRFYPLLFDLTQGKSALDLE